MVDKMKEFVVYSFVIYMVIAVFGFITKLYSDL